MGARVLEASCAERIGCPGLALGRRHRVGVTLADPAGDGESVSIFADSFRARVSPLEQLGKHSEGIGTKLALPCGGNAGMPCAMTITTLVVDAPLDSPAIGV